MTTHRRDARLKVAGWHPVPNEGIGGVADAMAELEFPKAHKAYPGRLRRVEFHDAEGAVILSSLRTTSRWLPR